MWSWDLSLGRRADDLLEVTEAGLRTSWQLHNLWQGTRSTQLDFGFTRSDFGLVQTPAASLEQHEYSLGLTQGITDKVSVFAQMSRFHYSRDPEALAKVLLDLRRRRRALPTAEDIVLGLLDSSRTLGVTYDATERLSLDLSRSTTSSVLLHDDTRTNSLDATYRLDNVSLGLGYARTEFEGGGHSNSVNLSLGLSTGGSTPPRGPARHTPSSDLPATNLTVGLRAGEDNAFDNFIDLLVPVAGNRSSVFFVNPRFSLNESYENGTSVGVGFRQLLGNDHAVLGANLYYDHATTKADSTLRQWGLGLEMLTNWVDARVNWYKPRDDRNLIDSETLVKTEHTLEVDYGDPFARGHEIVQTGTRALTTTTTTRLFEKFDAAREGYDAEIGVRLPLEKLSERAPDVRLFVGRYDYASPFGGDDLRGTRGRIEVRALPILTLDMELYDDDRLQGTSYFVGARMNIPFSLGDLFSGKNPFAGSEQLAARRGLRARINEMVVRETRIKDQQSDFMENLAARTVAVDVKRERFVDVLMSDINFVHADRFTGTADGTYENPYNTIQAGVDHAFGAKNVYVDSASSSYKENVVLADGVQLYGSGYRIAGSDGKLFGSGIRPVVDGNGTGPAIEVTSNNRVQGLRILNTAASAGADNRTLPDGTVVDVSQAGIVGNGVKGNILILDNEIVAATTAVGLAVDTASNTTLIGISGNTITSQTGTAVDLRTFNSAVAGIAIVDNTISGTNGVRINTNLQSSAIVLVLDNNVSAVNDGIVMDTDGSSTGCLQANGNSVSAGGDGFQLDRAPSSTLRIGNAGNADGLASRNNGASVNEIGTINYLGAGKPCL